MGNEMRDVYKKRKIGAQVSPTPNPPGAGETCAPIFLFL
jgi:hypothetical protein